MLSWLIVLFYVAAAVIAVSMLLLVIFCHHLIWSLHYDLANNPTAVTAITYG